MSYKCNIMDYIYIYIYIYIHMSMRMHMYTYMYTYRYVSIPLLRYPVNAFFFRVSGFASDQISHRSAITSRRDLEPAWSGLGAVLGPSALPLVPSWGRLGPPFGPPGAILGPSKRLRNEESDIVKSIRFPRVWALFCALEEPHSGQVGIHLGSISPLRRSMSQLFLEMLISTH